MVEEWLTLQEGYSAMTTRVSRGFRFTMRTLTTDLVWMIPGLPHFPPPRRKPDLLAVWQESRNSSWSLSR